VSKQFLNCADIRASLQEMSGEAVPESMGTDLSDTSFPANLTNDETQRAPIQRPVRFVTLQINSLVMQKSPESFVRLFP
jgi:hypothetical protein